MSSRAEKLAYFAGFFDGEGWISVSTFIRKSGYKGITAGAGTCQKTREVLEFAQSLFGSGNIYYQTARLHPIFTLEWRDLQAARMLEETLPYLKVKRLQAILFIDFAKQRSGRKNKRRKIPSGIWEYYQAVSTAMKTLNAAHGVNGVNSGEARNSSAVGNPEPSSEAERLHKALWEGAEISPDDILLSITDTSAPRESDDMIRTYRKL
jgi:hypothetical protein